MLDFPGAIDYFVDDSRVFTGQNDHKAIVCHGTGGSASQTVEQLGDWFRTNSAVSSVHYGIGRDGRIAQYVREQDGAGGNCCLDGNYDSFWDQFGGDNLNVHTLSFETINDSANSLPLTDPQKQTVFKLVKYWVDKYHIPLSNIKSHASIDAVNRARCPGPNFPWNELFDYLSGQEDKPLSIDLSNGTVANFFAGDSKTWTCKKTGFTLHGEILTFYQTYGGSGLCGLTHLGLPNSNELPVAGHPGIVEQEFERGAVRFDPDHKISFPPGAGRVYLIQTKEDPRTIALQSQVAQLENLPVVANFQQITTVGQRIASDVALILKLSQVQ